jgi:hypothetical protein
MEVCSSMDVTAYFSSPGVPSPVLQMSHIGALQGQRRTDHVHRVNPHLGHYTDGALLVQRLHS